MPFNTEHEQRDRRGERGGARRKNNENEHHTSNETSSLNKKLSSSKQPSRLSQKDDFLPESSKSSLAPVNSRKSMDLVDQTTSASVAVELQQHQQSIELPRQAYREFCVLLVIFDVSNLKNTYTACT